MNNNQSYKQRLGPSAPFGRQRASRGLEPYPRQFSIIFFFYYYYTHIEIRRKSGRNAPSPDRRGFLRRDPRPRGDRRSMGGRRRDGDRDGDRDRDSLGARGGAGRPATRTGDGDLRGRLEHDRHGRPDDVGVHGLFRRQQPVDAGPLGGRRGARAVRGAYAVRAVGRAAALGGRLRLPPRGVRPAGGLPDGLGLVLDRLRRAARGLRGARGGKT